MSYTAPDIADDLIEHLKDAGYSVHGGDLNEDGSVEPYEAEVDLDTAEVCWFTWTQTGCDIETGPSVPALLVAWATAMEHWFANAKIARDVK